jgi:hypothetical protein
MMRQAQPESSPTEVSQRRKPESLRAPASNAPA